MLPKKLQDKVTKRYENGALRKLTQYRGGVDFASNDYLGFSTREEISRTISQRAQELLVAHHIHKNGATGSRLLSGNHKLFNIAEKLIATHHGSESALIFNSGYDANIGLFQSVPQRGDIIIYDEYIHASIRDGISMSMARSYKFKHNNIEDLAAVIGRVRKMHHLDEMPEAASELYIVTESVFSMDGNTPELQEMVNLCEHYNARLIVDEAHAIGVFEKSGAGIVKELNTSHAIFARIVTFGKGLGAHGAAILGSGALKQYLVNFARSFIYTTGLSPHAVAVIIASYEYLQSNSVNQGGTSLIQQLHERITFFKKHLKLLKLEDRFVESDSAIHCAIIPGNEEVITLSRKLSDAQFYIKPIRSPTVPQGAERLRICLHAFNSEKEIYEVLSIVKQHLTAISSNDS